MQAFESSAESTNLRASSHGAALAETDYVHTVFYYQPVGNTICKPPFLVNVIVISIVHECMAAFEHDLWCIHGRLTGLDPMCSEGWVTFRV